MARAYDCAVVEKARFAGIMPWNRENTSPFRRITNAASVIGCWTFGNRMSIEERDLIVEEVARLLPHHCTNIGLDVHV